MKRRKNICLVSRTHRYRLLQQSVKRNSSSIAAAIEFHAPEPINKRQKSTNMEYPISERISPPTLHYETEVLGSNDSSSCLNPSQTLEPFINTTQDALNQNHTHFTSQKKSDSEISEEVISQLRSWAIYFGITHLSLKTLLDILRQHPLFCQFLPKDPRSFLKTQRNVKVTKMSPGIFYHFGLGKGLRDEVELALEQSAKVPDILKLHVNIDGLPLFKSTSADFIPILGLVRNIENSKVFIISLWYGKGKPQDSNTFLKKFVNEYNEIRKDGIMVKNQKFTVSFDALIADAPAKSYVCKTKGHTGYSSCPKCKAIGKRINRTTCFYDFTAELRSHQEFVDAPHEENNDFLINFEENNLENSDNHEGGFDCDDGEAKEGEEEDDDDDDTDEEDDEWKKKFHKGNTSLTKIEDFDMIKKVPYDPLHLFDIGIMKQILKQLAGGKPKVKMSKRETQSFNESWLFCEKFIPSEFNRRPRPLAELCRWKATELRLFLLYLGPLVLYNSFLNRDEDPRYINFMELHIATRIFSSKKLCHKYLSFAGKLLLAFVKNFKSIYGESRVNHNVHGLIHVEHDVKEHGTLDEYSAWPFENFMQSLKKLIRKPKQPLQQVVKRLSEKKKCEFIKEEKLSAKFQFEQCHKNGPLPENCSNPQYKVARNEKIIVSSGVRDNCLKMVNGSIVRVENICYSEKQEKIVIVGREYSKVSSIYKKPYNSFLVNSYMVENLSAELQIWPFENIEAKIMKIPLNDTADKEACFALLH